MKTILLFLLLGFLINPVSSENIKENPVIQPLSQKKYFDELSNQIRHAKKNIYVILSHFSCRTDDAENPLLKVVNNLVLAQMEGISVKIIMNPQFHLMKLSNELSLSKVDPGFYLLKSAGIPIAFTLEKSVIHYNLLIIDDHIVIEGTLPWISDINLDYHFYANNLIRSENVAEIKLEEVKKLNCTKKLFSDSNQFKGPFAFFPDIIFRKNIFKKFDHEKYAPFFDMYLLLLLNYPRKKNRPFTLNVRALISSLFTKTHTKIEAAKKINSYVKKLDKSGLIKMQKQNRNILVQIIDEYKNKKSFFKMPLNYFHFKYFRILSLNQKKVYLRILFELSNSDTFPYFIISDKFKKDFPKIKTDNFDQIICSLEKFLLIEKKSVTMQENFLNGSRYILRDPPNLSLIKRAFDLLMQEHGEKTVKKAQIMASQLNMERHPEVVRDILYFMKELGFLETQKIFHQIISLPLNSSERNFKCVKKYLVKFLNEKLNSDTF